MDPAPVYTAIRHTRGRDKNTEEQEELEEELESQLRLKQLICNWRDWLDPLHLNLDPLEPDQDQESPDCRY